METEREGGSGRERKKESERERERGWERRGEKCKRGVKVWRENKYK